MSKKSTEKSRLRRAIAQQLYRSHERLLEEALKVTPEVTDLMKLREMYPHYDVDKLLRLQRLNIKINAANDFLIEEQYYWLNPSERPAEGIEYDEELWATTSYDEDEELAIIREEQKGLDDE